MGKAEREAARLARFHREQAAIQKQIRAAQKLRAKQAVSASRAQYRDRMARLADNSANAQQRLDAEAKKKTPSEAKLRKLRKQLRNAQEAYRGESRRGDAATARIRKMWKHLF